MSRQLSCLLGLPTLHQSGRRSTSAPKRRELSVHPSSMLRACGHGPRKRPFALRLRIIFARELGVAVAGLTRRLPQWRTKLSWKSLVPPRRSQSPDQHRSPATNYSEHKNTGATTQEHRNHHTRHEDRQVVSCSCVLRTAGHHEPFKEQRVCFDAASR